MSVVGIVLMIVAILAVLAIIASIFVNEAHATSIRQWVLMVITALVGVVTGANALKLSETGDKVDTAVIEQKEMVKEQKELAKSVDAAASKADVAASKAEEVAAVQVEAKEATDEKLKTLVETTKATKKLVETKLGPME